MNLVLFARERITALYGQEAPAVTAALERLLAARAGAGLLSLVYDPQAGLPDLAVTPTTLEAAALAAQLALIERALSARGAIIESLTIIGGPGVVPFGSLPNPLPDSDADVQSDCLYGLAGPEVYLARWPVGRLPDAVPPEPGLLVGLLDTTARLHHAARRVPRTLGLTTERWRESSAEVLAAVAPPLTVLVSPPLTAATLDRQALAAAAWIYCNLHGVRGGPFWYGHGRNDSALIPVVRPADLDGLSLDGALVISQACYGARLATQAGMRALAPAFLAAGVRGFIGALALTYGAPQPPIAESDLLTACLLQALARPGARIGPAFQAAHGEMVRILLQTQGFVDAGDLKTLLEFVLYGDPTLPVGLAPFREEPE